MKKVVLSLVAALVLMASPAVAQDENWFDMQNCEICKHMGKHMDIMQDIKWEAHLLSNGMLTIAVVPEKHKKVMDDVHKKMKGTIAKLESGEQMDLCGFCTTMGKLKMAGVESEELETAGGQIMVMTSDDPKAVEKIHKFAKRTIEEQKKMKAAQGGGGE